MDRIPFVRLWDIYHGLLTPTQQEITDMYFNLDLTLSEIAEQKGITRQGVSECMKVCRKQLEEYEDKLHISENLSKYSLEVSCMMTDIGRWAERFKAAHPEYAGDIEELNAIILKDYSKEAEAGMNSPELYKDRTEEVYGRKKDGEE